MSGPRVSETPEFEEGIVTTLRAQVLFQGNTSKQPAHGYHMPRKARYHRSSEFSRDTLMALLHGHYSNFFLDSNLQ